MLGQQTRRSAGQRQGPGSPVPYGDEIEADLVVIAAGIRPNADLGRSAGLEVNRGILVNDYMETSHPDIFAVGECMEHRGQVFGLVAPLFDQGRCSPPPSLATRALCSRVRRLPTKLKIMGIDVFSAGDIKRCRSRRGNGPL